MDDATSSTDAEPSDAAPIEAVLPEAVPAARRRPPGSLEEEVLGVLHSSGELSPGEVRDLLPDSGRLSYSAVVTTLTRLHAKGVVTRRRHGRAYLYSAPGDPATLVAWRMNRLLAGQADHRRALTHFIAALSPTDEALVRDLLASAPAQPGGVPLAGGDLQAHGDGGGAGTAPGSEPSR
ncbi:CopY family transcriptional regulator [Frankia sp. CcI49]|uniref:BlaI/MecI/CopY family transcriptional regulator n=1 Tax=Frankia sp. CcI49 TaxID=1745382 RepID=UPI0009788D8D|nr:BlaI/MecI/CopY family transcriptional regulator [Frankia sp. CcI49]ONH61019.1 CopY family transcriptional regulator [Frankia sp. CcI49]